MEIRKADICVFHRFGVKFEAVCTFFELMGYKVTE